MGRFSFGNSAVSASAGTAPSDTGAACLLRFARETDLAIPGFDATVRLREFRKAAGRIYHGVLQHFNQNGEA